MTGFSWIKCFLLNCIVWCIIKYGYVSLKTRWKQFVLQLMTWNKKPGGQMKHVFVFNSEFILFFLLSGPETRRAAHGQNLSQTHWTNLMRLCCSRGKVKRRTHTAQRNTDSSSLLLLLLVLRLIFHPAARLVLGLLPVPGGVCGRRAVCRSSSPRWLMIRINVFIPAVGALTFRHGHTQ